MKKIISLALALCTCMALGTGLTACGGSEKEKEPATAQEVTKNQFQAALSFEGVQSVTCSFHLTADDYFQSKTIYIEGNKSQMGEGTNAQYVEKTAEAQYLYYYTEFFDDTTIGGMYGYTGWVKGSIDGDVRGSVEKLASTFKYMAYSNFTFADGVYSYSYTDGEESGSYQLQFENKKLTAATLRTQTGEEVVTTEYGFSNYGTTTVSLPTEYKEVSGTSKPTSDWASYFALENVSIVCESTTEYTTPIVMTIEERETMKIDGERWVWTASEYFYNGTTEKDFVVSYDGMHAYVGDVADNALDDDLIVEGELFTINVTCFADYENLFTEVSTGVYHADELSFGLNNVTQTNITITIVEGKLKTVQYTMTSTAEYAFVSQYTYTFSDWGTTEL